MIPSRESARSPLQVVIVTLILKQAVLNSNHFNKHSSNKFKLHKSRPLAHLIRETNSNNQMSHLNFWRRHIPKNNTTQTKTERGNKHHYIMQKFSQDLKENIKRIKLTDTWQNPLRLHNLVQTHCSSKIKKSLLLLLNINKFLRSLLNKLLSLKAMSQCFKLLMRKLWGQLRILRKSLINQSHAKLMIRSSWLLLKLPKLFKMRKLRKILRSLRLKIKAQI